MVVKKGLLKKEEKGIIEIVSGIIYDWGEFMFKIILLVLLDFIEVVNSFVKIFMFEKKEDKKDEKKKGNCYCNRDIIFVELIKMVKNIRDNIYYDGKIIMFFYSDKLFYLYVKVLKFDRIFEKFVEVLNKVFSKYEIMICVRKIYFFVNMYVEIMYFIVICEGKGILSFRYDFYRGRGF